MIALASWSIAVVVTASESVRYLKILVPFRSSGKSRALQNLLGRALSLMRDDDPDRLELLPVLADALAETGENDPAYELATEAIEVARAQGHRGIESYALAIVLKLPRKPGFRLSLGYGLGREEGFRLRD